MYGKLEYVAVAPRASLWLRLWNGLAGRKDKRGVYHQFLKDNNIDRNNPYDRNVTRNKYMIHTHHIERLNDLRQQAIQREFIKVDRKQKSVVTQTTIMNGILEKEQKTLHSFEEQLKSISKQLDDISLTPLQKAHLQGAKGTLEASLANQADTVESTKGKALTLQNIHKENTKSFMKVIKDTQAVYTVLLNEYIKFAGRPLHTIGFTNYDAELPDMEQTTREWEKELRDAI